MKKETTEQKVKSILWHIVILINTAIFIYYVGDLGGILNGVFILTALSLLFKLSYGYMVRDTKRMHSEMVDEFDDLSSDFIGGKRK